MESIGFTECLLRRQGVLTPTFKNPRGGKVIHQMDHLFVNSALLESLVSCGTGSPERVFGESMSDHLPIVADFGD